MICYFVRYRGSAADPAAFVDHYATHHVAILKEFPGIRTLALHEPAVWNDPFPVRDDGTTLLVQMTFNTPADLQRALHSEARRRAREDFGRFPPFSGEVTHQAMRSRIIF
jgi:uncharacterized protein (TIGR02118 family)